MSNYVQPLVTDNNCDEMYLTGYNVTRIVYELIRNYMNDNTPAKCGVQLSQTYSNDPSKSSIHLDIGYNWQTSKVGKVPAVYVQRGAMAFKNPTIGAHTGVNEITGEDRRRVFVTMPVTVSCLAAEPVAVVENLAEYVKQPLLYFRKEVEIDFGLRRFMVESITPPKIEGNGKNNFAVDINVLTVFDEGWKITKESLKMRRISVALFDSVMQPIQAFNV